MDIFHCIRYLFISPYAKHKRYHERYKHTILADINVLRSVHIMRGILLGTISI